MGAFTPTLPADLTQGRSYTTYLTPPQEAAFQQWVRINKVPFDPMPNSDYDMRGFWKALISGDPVAKTAVSAYDNRIHFPDKWKTPFHKTFSNESIYATPSDPHWVGDKLIDKSGHVLADETPKPKKKTVLTGGQ